MLNDSKLKSLKPRDKLYKVADRDGIYVTVATTGAISFRLDYRMNGRRESVTLGRYGADGITLVRARELAMAARAQVREGRSPMIEKQRAKAALNGAKTFGEWATKWFEKGVMADSTRAMRQSIYDRDIKSVFENRLLLEIEPQDVRALCEKIVARDAPATAIHVREQIKLIFAFARLHGVKIDNPATEVSPASIATFVPRERSLTPKEIRMVYPLLEQVPTLPTIRLGMKLILLTLVRKSELTFATWDEVDFVNAVWCIPAARMKCGRPHNVYLSRQALDIMIALRTCAGNSPYLLPSRYEPDQPMSRATFNRVTTAIADRARANRQALAPFTVHDLRRTGSTLLNEVGFEADWVEKCLAHVDRRTSRRVYNVAEYAAGRKHMLQEWADMIDAWVAGRTHTPVLHPSATHGVTLDPRS
ncbi:tyrosine-type recombinase/integrase [Caulobacter endophyticus]|uniref:Integrase n=1 Tax=Caulobacter endophyticus TaxID=2172652 RepID=A0A2T9K9X7_9CAUL|nr:tyrosine-type recombinase/integrase [Caulobacter endophyticus]PVM92777.1 integrase [Caulobacter endophyticus]